MRRRLVCALVLLAAIAAPTAIAAFLDSATVSHTITTATVSATGAVASTHPSPTAGTVNASWTVTPTTTATNVQVLRATNPSGPFSVIATLAANATSHSDTTAAYNTQYYYATRVNAGTWFSDSSVAQAFSLPIASGTDKTASTTGTAFTAGNITSLSVSDANRFTPAAAWNPLGSVPAGGWLLGLDYVDATHAWAVGSGGVILFWNGTLWTSQTSGVTNTLYDIAFPSATVGWTVGTAGTLLKTINGGTTWTAQTSGTAQRLNGVDCISTTVCWAVGDGGVIIKTTNGTNWSAQTSGVGTRLIDIDCVDANTCWAVGTGGVVRATTNGGTNWTGQTSGTTSDLRGVSCVSSTACWVSGFGGTIIKWNGSAWAAQTSGVTVDLYRMTMVDANTGWAIGDTGTIRATTNGGANWSAQTPNPSTNFNAAECISTTTCMIVGDGAVVLQTTNGGSTWGPPPNNQSIELTPTAPTLASGAPVTTVKATIVYQVSAVPPTGSGMTMYASADGGTNWTPFTVALPTAANADTSATVDLSGMGWSPATRIQNVRLKLILTVATGTAISTPINLVHLDVN